MGQGGAVNWRLVCALAALALVVSLFVGGAQPVAVGLLAAPWDKLAHGAVFGLLAALLVPALQGAHLLHGRAALGQRQARVLAALLATVVAVADEAHQIRLPGRVASLNDLLADGVGIAAALLFLHGLTLLAARRAP